MAYTDFTLESVEIDLGIPQRQAQVFTQLPKVEPPAWLPSQLARGMELALISEKARSEFIVAPILLAVRELSGGRVAILSGSRLDVDPSRRLVGECDFLLSLSDPLPRLRPPLVAVLQAKRNDLEAGLGPCAAQLMAVRLFNERAGEGRHAVYGCVTTGTAWQFLRLDESGLAIDPVRRYIIQLEAVLGALLAAVQSADTMSS